MLDVFISISSCSTTWLWTKLDISSSIWSVWYVSMGERWKYSSRTIIKRANGTSVSMAMCLSRPTGMPYEENVLTLSCNPFSWSMLIRLEILSISVNYLNKRWFKPSRAAVSRTSMFSFRAPVHCWRVRWKFSLLILWLHHDANAVCSVYSITIVGLGCWLVRFVDEYLCCGYLRSSVDESGRERKKEREAMNGQPVCLRHCVLWENEERRTNDYIVCICSCTWRKKIKTSNSIEFDENLNDQQHSNETQEIDPFNRQSE